MRDFEEKGGKRGQIYYYVAVVYLDRDILPACPSFSLLHLYTNDCVNDKDIREFKRIFVAGEDKQFMTKQEIDADWGNEQRRKDECDGTRKK